MYYTIPSNGFQFISNKYNKIYYYDPVSNKGQWNPFNLNYTIKLPEYWVIVTTKEKVYFYNTRTKKTQYEIPENTLINPLEGVADPLKDYYIEQGIPLEDYKNTLVGLEKIGIVIPQGDITKITGGCKNISDITKLIDYLLQHSPNLREIDLSNCEVTPEIVEKLLKFSKLQVVISTKSLKLPARIINACSLVESWDQFNSELEYWLSGGGGIDSLWAKLIKYNWAGASPLCRVVSKIIKGLLATGHNPQKGYDGFIEALINGNRYSHELFPYRQRNPLWSGIYQDEDQTIVPILTLFFQYGAKPKLDRLLRPENQMEIFGQSEPNIQDEDNYAHIKGMLIDTLYELNPEYVSPEKLNKYLPPDWNSIQPKYWQETDDEDYENSSSFINQYWEHMKYFSKRLLEYKR